MVEGEGLMLSLAVLLSELDHLVGVGWKHLWRMVGEGEQDMWHLLSVAW